MRSKIDTHISVRHWFALFGFVTAALLTFFSAFIALYASHVLRQSAYDTSISNLGSYCRQFENALRGEELYLAGFTYDSSLINALDQADPADASWFRASYALQEEFTSEVGLSSWKNYFYYSPFDDLLLTSRAFTGNGHNKESLIPYIDSLYGRETQSAEDGNYPARGWELLQIDSAWYLLYVRHQRNGYLGSCVRLSGYLSTLNDREGEIRSDFCTEAGALLGNNSKETLHEPPADFIGKGYTFEESGGLRKLVCVLPAKGTPLYMLSFTPDHSVEASVRIFRSFVLLLLLIGLLVFIIFYLTSNRMVTAPVQQILRIMQHIRSGDRDARIRLGHGCREFIVIGRAFNDTVDEIDRLSDTILTEQLSKKQAQIEYLKLQVTPHFLINCLNSVHQLTEIGRSDLSLQMTEGLTTFLRYLLDCGRSVSLAEELRQAENYASFSLIRYPGGISFQSIVEPGAENATVVPYLILGFVENTVKYSVTPGSMTCIEVQAGRTPEGELRIRMSDTGGGYSEEALQRLNHLSDPSSQTNPGHIGLENVYHRVRLVLGECCRFHFENDPVTGGAINTVQIPWKPWIGT